MSRPLRLNRPRLVRRQADGVEGEQAVADAWTHLVINALSRAAAHPLGLPLFSSRGEVGLFPSGNAARAAAQKCLREGLLQPYLAVGSGSAGSASAGPDLSRAPERYVLGPAGWAFLQAHAFPRQVLEDFVRVLENRLEQSASLLRHVQQMADELRGLREAVFRLWPQGLASSGGVAMPHPPVNGNGANSASSEKGVEIPSDQAASERLASLKHPSDKALGEPPHAALAATILAVLQEWCEHSGHDCPLPELYRSVCRYGGPPSLGQFHDALRELHQQGAIHLHPWTGPLYSLPEPAYALLVGHGVAYYASSRRTAATPASAAAGATRDA